MESQHGLLHQTIKVRVSSVDALLDTNSPVVAPGIHPAASQALWAEIQPLNPAATWRFEVTVPPSDLAREVEVRDALQSHFQNEAAAAGAEVRGILRDGWASARIGLALAVALLVISEALLRIGDKGLTEFCSRGLVVVAWVALWHPADLLVYAHLPVRARRKRALKAAAADVVLRPA